MTTVDDPSHPINEPDLSLYEGNVYALSATGGFTMERRFEDIKLHPQSEPVYVDVTESIQLAMDVATFKAKLGTFDPVTDTWASDTITIEAADVLAEITNASRVLSVGKYSTLYSDFQSYVADYFGRVEGFSSLFEAASEFAIDENNEFNGESFVALINTVAPNKGSYTNELIGSIEITDINKLLRYAVDGNVFGNRVPGGTNWGVGDGFVAGDLIWVPDGTTVTLKLGIDAEALNPINNPNPNSAYVENITSINGNFSLEATATTEMITRVVKAPLLIKLITV
jgi:hypothetical protein